MSHKRLQLPTWEEFNDEEITLEELLHWLEFGCWTTICLCPFLYFINGPSVSPDQAVVRTMLVIGSVVGAVGLRTFKILRRRAGRADENRGQA